MVNDLCIRRSIWRYLIIALFFLGFVTFIATTFLLNDLNTVSLPNKPKVQFVLNVDQRKAPSFEQQLKDAEESLPNLPLEYAKKIENVMMHKNYNATCAQFPNLREIKYNSIYWQTLESSNGTFYLYGAYFDTRDEERPAIRILAMVDRVELAIEPHMQIWIDNVTKPILVEAICQWSWYRPWGGYVNGELQPYLITGFIDSKHLHSKPAAVSLVEKECDKATTCLKITNLRPKTAKTVAYCVKGLDFFYEDLTLKMVEWLELLRIMGVDKVFLYDLYVHPNISKILDHYQEIGFVEVTPLTLPAGLPNTPVLQHDFLERNIVAKRKLELIPYNDCLYRNLYSYKYISLIDIDEVIVPLQDDTLEELIARMESSQASRADSFNVQNLYYLDRYMQEQEYPDPEEAPPYMHMMSHIYRATNFTAHPKRIKSLMDTSRVVFAHNHFPLTCRDNPCKNHQIETDVGRMHHYRKDCTTKGKITDTCEDQQKHYHVDKTLWKYKNRLIPKVQNTLKKLGFLQ